MANDFLVFGGAAGANVINQATYAALTARSAGFSSGIAQSGQLNKVWRQSSIMSAVLAQFIADRTGLDVLDDGTTSTILANLKASAATVNGDATKAFSVAAATASNHAVNLSQVPGLAQTWQDMTASRAVSTTYTNTTGKPIFVSLYSAQSSSGGASLTINGLAVAAALGQITGGSFIANCFGIVPAGATYSAPNWNGGKWFEMR